MSDVASYGECMTDDEPVQGYPEPRTPLSDAATDVGRNLVKDDANWLATVIFGYVDSHPVVTPREYSLDVIAMLDGLRRGCDGYLRNSVAAARRDGASWSQIGDALNVSKQTAYSRYGSAIEERDGQLFINDVVRDAEIPLQRIDSTTPPRPTPSPIPATADQRRIIAEHFEGTDGVKPENIDLVVNAIMINAQAYAARSGADWSNPTDANHYLNLALALFKPKAALRNAPQG